MLNILNITKALNSFEILNTNEEITESGVVLSTGDGVAWIDGLQDIQMGELVAFNPVETNGTMGVVLNLEEQLIGAVIFGNDRDISEGTEVLRCKVPVQVPVGKELCGRVVDALGNPIDNLGKIEGEFFNEIEIKAPGIISRQPVTEPFQTGIFVVDVIFGVGKGQRELIIGDRQMGKTTVAIDSILNQRSLKTESELDSNQTFCIYVAIGQKRSSVAQLVSRLSSENALAYTVVVSATASESAALQFLAAYTGCTIGEWFRDNTEDALIVYDDLSKQAVAYRQISLLLQRPPGREAYPGDVFYLHSRLLERSAKLSDVYGSGSLTSLPVIETQAGDVSGYIPTNVISITDGQLFLERELFYGGVLPAIHVGLSVSRIGSAAQTPAMKTVAKSLKSYFSQYKELESVTSLADAEIDDYLLQILNRGERILELLKQPPYQPLPVEYQIILAYGASLGFFDVIPAQSMSKFKEVLINTLNKNYLNSSFGLTIDVYNSNPIKVELAVFLQNFVEEFLFTTAS